MKSLLILVSFLAGSWPAGATTPQGVQGPATQPTGPAPATGAPGGGAAPQAPTPDPRDQSNPINQITDALQDAAGGARLKASAVIYNYMTDLNNRYVSVEAYPDIKTPEGDKQLKATVVSWVMRNSNDNSMRRKVAELFLVVVKPADDTTILLRNMQPWSSQAPSGSGTGPLKGTNADSWVTAFLDRAADEADKIFTQSQSKCDMDCLRNKVNVDNHPIGVPEGSGATRRKPVEPPLPKEDWESLYKIGGTEPITLGQDGDSAGRTIVIKLYSRKEEDGSIKNEVRIYDITDPSMGKPQAQWDIFSQGFPTTQQNSQTFQLDDRTPGKKKYTLTMNPQPDGNVEILFSRDGVQATGDNHKEGNMIRTTLNDLARLRAEQVVREGADVTIDGKKYIAFGAAGGGLGSLCYYPADIAAKAAGGDPEQLKPELISNIKRTTGGTTNRIVDKPELGVVNGKPWHLEWDSTLHYWKPVPGEGQKEPKPTPPQKPDPKNPAGGGGAGGGTPTGPGNPTGGNPLANGYYAVDAEATKGAPDGWTIYTVTAAGEKYLKEKHPTDAYMMRNQVTIKSNGWNFYVVFQPRADGKAYAVDGKAPVRFFKAGDKTYMRSQSDGGVLYMDPSQLQEPDQAHRNVAVVGTVAFSAASKDLQSVKENALLAQALSDADFKPEQTKVAAANLAKVQCDTDSHELNGNIKALTFKCGASDTTMIWPSLKKPEAKDPNHKETETGSAFDNIPTGPWQDFEKDPKVDDATLQIVKQTQWAALYYNGVDPAKATAENQSRWYVIFGFVNHGDHDKKMRSKFVEVFNKGGTAVIAPPTADKSVDGFSDPKSKLDLMQSGLSMKLLGARKKASGVYCVYATRSATKKDKEADTLGPVVWWGMSKDDAQKACVKGE